MRAIEAQELIKRFDAPQKRRLHVYTRNLSTDRDHRHRDSRVRQVLDEYAYDVEHVEKVYNYLESIGFSQSIYRYEQINAQILKFGEPNHKYMGWLKSYTAVKKEMKDEFRSFRLTSMNFKSDFGIKEALPRKDTHAGFSWLLTGKKWKSEYMEGVHETWMQEVVKAKKSGSHNKPILIGTRTQASGQFTTDGCETGTFKHKSRMVSMVDVYQIISEMVFSKPLQGAMAHVRWYAGGYNDATLGNLIADARHRNTYSMTIDYSGFDQSISAWLINDAFEIMKEAFAYDPLFDERLYSVIVNDFIHKVFVDGRGNLIESHKGVPSGSMFTQLVDSIVNRLVILTYAKAKKVDVRDMFIMGDDNLILSKDEINEVDLSEYVLANFGLTVHPFKCSKSTTKEAPEFLSRFWDFHGVWREPNVLISKLIFPERFRDYKMKHGPDPKLILYSYVLTYPLGMRSIMDVDKFKRDNMREVSKFTMSDYFRWLPGSARFRMSEK